MVKFRKKLSTKQFIVSLAFILILSLIFLGGLYYILNIQYQQPKNLFLRGPVTMTPKSLILNLDQPDDNLLTFQSSIIISGKTAPAVDILISTDLDDLVIKSKIDGSFSTILELREGVNIINVIVFDTNGNSKSTQRTVYFSKEKI